MIIQPQNDEKILLTIGEDEENMEIFYNTVLNFLELNLVTGINRFKIMTILSSSNYTSKTLF